MPTYTKLTEDEKTAIQEAAARSLEYQMYALEVEKIAENAKTSPDSDKVAELNASIAEKQAQITAVLA
jgi:hypothetical protein